jgi:predicted outer membrane repeat protein
MNCKSFTRNASFLLLFSIFSLAVCAQAQIPRASKAVKINEKDRTPAKNLGSTNSKFHSRNTEKLAALLKELPTSASKPANLAKWARGKKRELAFRPAATSRITKTRDLSPEKRRELKAFRKAELETLHKNRTAGSNARIATPSIIYVDQDAVGFNDGSSWDNAYTELSDALLSASAGNEIWITWGTYKPQYLPNVINPTASTNRDNSFVLIPDVKIYGGFNGGEESIEERNLFFTDGYGLIVDPGGIALATILSGDFDDNDGTPEVGGDLFSNTGENAYHVVISAEAVGEAELNGVIIAGGNADGIETLTVNGLEITRETGGGMAIFNSSPKLTNVVFKNNQASSGSAIYADASPFVLTNALVVTNRSTIGGIYLNESSAVITNCTIAENPGNSVTGSGAGIFAGGITASTPTIRNTIIYGNSSYSNPNVDRAEGAVPTFSYCLLQNSGGSGDNWVAAFGTDGTHNLDVDPKFYDTGVGYFDLSTESPAIGAGNNDLFGIGGTPDLSEVTTDLVGNQRIGRGVVDIGAFESESGFLSSGFVPTDGRLYVSKGGYGSTDGSSWDNAAAEFADALRDASTNSAITEIWISYGTYKPLYYTDGTTGAGNQRDKAFVLVPGLNIYGGFVGDETSIAERDLRGTDSYGLVMQPEGYESATILSGDFNGDDGGGCGCSDDIYDNTAENAYHVVVSAGNVGSASLDGVIIAGGNATGASTLDVNAQAIDRSTGGGIAIYDSAPMISNVVIRNNQATSGGAIYASASPFVLTNALVVTNQSHQGGIDLNNDSSPIITNTTIAGNKGDGEDADGAGIRSLANSDAQIRNTIVYGNTVGSNTNVSFGGSTKPTFSYSIVEGSGIFWDTSFGVDGLNNSPFPPSFHDPESGAFGLKPSSFAINRGNNTLFLPSETPNLSSITTDVRGTARKTRETVDIGAIESLYGDLTSTLQPDVNGRLYVKKDIAVSGDGSSWDDAVAEVADALFAAALKPAITEIWVAGGIYHPLYRADNLSNEDESDKYNVFSLVSGVKIYGGFAGTETTLADRDLSKKENASILSADINKDDAEVISDDEGESLSENLYHVVYAVGTTDAILDGFTVQGANVLTPLLTGSETETQALLAGTSLINESLIQDAFGSGVTLYGPDLKMSNLIVKKNYGFTGAVVLTGEEASINNSLIHSNIGVIYGSAITSFGTDMAIINVTATENLFYSIIMSEPVGIGVMLISGTSKISNSIIYGNSIAGSDSGIPPLEFYFLETGGDEAVYSHSIIGGIGNEDCGCGITGTNGGNNLDADPLFRDIDNQDFSLQACSPAINLGTNEFYEAGGSPDLTSVTKDLVGFTRINQEFVDAGSFEFQSNLAGLNGSEETHNFTTEDPYTFGIDADCPVEILRITPTTGVTLGNVTARLWIDNEVKMFNSAVYVQRHFDIEPQPEKEESTATVTLYFSQTDFNNFNQHVDEDEYLPIGNDDDNGEEERIANLRIYQFHGKSSDNSGNPSKYPGSRTVITPSLVEWNETDKRWEATFAVDGFSGFFAGTEAHSPLPVRLISFGGKLNERNKVQLDWKVTEQQNISSYLVEYSGNGKNFSQIGSVTANTLENTQYTFTDNEPHSGQLAYYRLKILEMDGTHAYSRLISMKLPAGENTIVYPVPAKNMVWLDWKGSAGNSADLSDLNGRIIKTIKRLESTQQIDISGLAPGVYFLKMSDGTAMKLVKE